MNCRSLFAALMLCLCLPAAGALAQDALADDAPTAYTLTVEERERTFTVHVPETPLDPAPLVIALHGRGGDGSSMERLTHMSDVADQEGFIVAYPDGLDNEWNFVLNIPGYPNAHDDSLFLAALVDQLAEDYAIDSTRVYVAGFSNGGFMAQRLACEHPEQYAAYASVGAAGFGGMPLVCQERGSVPAPMLLMHGTQDFVVPFDGETVRRGDRMITLLYPVSNTVGFWSEFNGCQPEGVVTDIPQTEGPEGTAVRVLTIECPEETEVLLYVVLGGGHNWPGQEAFEPAEIFGAITHDINASQVIWEFFAGHSRIPTDEGGD